MTEETPRPPPDTAVGLRRNRKGANRAVALILLAITAVFLGGAVGVALLVSYGPF